MHVIISVSIVAACVVMARDPQVLKKRRQLTHVIAARRPTKAHITTPRSFNSAANGFFPMWGTSTSTSSMNIVKCGSGQEEFARHDTSQRDW